MTTKTDIETQPRYVIDDEDSAKETRKILAEEQTKALQKLIGVGGHALDGEERDLIEKLKAKLESETQRVKNLKKVTIKDKPLDAYLDESKKGSNHKSAKAEESEETENEDEEKPAKRRHHAEKKVVGFAPDEVVKRYLECFNQQRFGAEYDCFSQDFMTTDRNSYIQARQKYYQQQQALGGLTIKCEKVHSTDVMGGIAEVVATKSIQSGKKKPKYETDVYHLKLENGRWQINMVEPQEE